MNIPAMVTFLTTGKKLSSKEQAKALYEGKTFYIKNPDGTLDGPRDDIYYAVDRSSFLQKIKSFLKREQAYKFIQITDGSPRQAFYKNEIKVVQND